MTENEQLKVFAELDGWVPWRAKSVDTSRLVILPATNTQPWAYQIVSGRFACDWTRLSWNAVAEDVSSHVADYTHSRSNLLAFIDNQNTSIATWTLLLDHLAPSTLSVCQRLKQALFATPADLAEAYLKAIGRWVA